MDIRLPVRPGPSRRSLRALTVFLVAGGALLAGCDSQSSPGTAGRSENEGATVSQERSQDAAGDRPLVVCTTTIIADLARQLAGERVRVVGIMPPGTDPHVYEPRPDDSVLLRKADLILYNGLHLEGRMVQMFDGAGERAVALGEDERIVVRGSAQHGGVPDPHVWWNARFFMVYAERARDALIRLDPDGAGTYRARAAAYLEALADLDGRVRAAVAKIPARRRYLITSHDAFYYYGDAYGLQVDSVLGISTDAQVRALRVNELAKLVMEHDVPAVFHETSVSAALNEMVDRVVELCAKRGQSLSVSPEPLYSDSLSEPGTPAGTYLGALRENTRIIVGALSGEDVRGLLESVEDDVGRD